MSKTGDSKEKSMGKVLRFINNYSTDWIEKAFAGDSHLIGHLQSKWDALAKSQDSSYEAMVKLMTQMDAENENKLMKYIDATFAKGGVTGAGTEKVNRYILLDKNNEPYVDSEGSVQDTFDALEDAKKYRMKNDLLHLRIIKAVDTIGEQGIENTEYRKKRFSSGGSMAIGGEIKEGQTYHIDTEFEGRRLVDDVTIQETPKKTDKKILVHSPKLMANILVRKSDLKEIEKPRYSVRSTGYSSFDREYHAFDNKEHRFVKTDSIMMSEKTAQEKVDELNSSGGSMATGGGVGEKTIRDLAKEYPEMWDYNYKWRNTESPELEKDLEQVLSERGYKLDERDWDYVGQYNDLKGYLNLNIIPEKSSGGSMATGGGIRKKDGKKKDKNDVAWFIFGMSYESLNLDEQQEVRDEYFLLSEAFPDEYEKRDTQFSSGGSMATGGEAGEIDLNKWKKTSDNTWEHKGKDIKYKIVGGTAYHKETPDEVVRALETARNTRSRVKLYYGDVKTGRDWHEEYDTVGTIGRSTGEIKIPLLIKTGRSLGGGSVLDHCIVKIKDTRTGIVIYQNPKYIAPKIEIVPSDMEGYSHNTIIDGELHGRHKTLRSAEMVRNKMMEKGGEAKVEGNITDGINNAIHYLDGFESFWEKPKYADEKAKELGKRLEKLKNETNYHIQKAGLTKIADEIGGLYQDDKLPEDSLGFLAGALDSLNEVIDEAYGKGGSVKKSSGGNDICWLITG